MGSLGSVLTFSCMLVMRYMSTLNFLVVYQSPSAWLCPVPNVMPISNVPKPKGKHVNITESDNNRGIALSSILLVSFLIWSLILHRYYDLLCSCSLQFGFKRHRSTDVCTMLLKETVSYYVNNEPCLLHIS